MNKMLFVLDEKKASRLSGVSVSKLWGQINENALNLGLKVVKNGEYHASNKPHEVVILSKFIIDDLLNISWFTRSLLSWECYWADGTKDDLIALAKAKGYGVWDEVSNENNFSI